MFGSSQPPLRSNGLKWVGRACRTKYGVFASLFASESDRLFLFHGAEFCCPETQNIAVLSWKWNETGGFSSLVGNHATTQTGTL